METKICKKCGEEKEVASFPTRKEGDKKHPRNYCRSCDAASSRAWRAANPELARESAWRATIRRRYGLTVEDYNALHVAQEGRCAICGATEANSRDTRLYVDHDHKTGQVRALLCSTCNAGLGSFKEDVSLMLAAVEYLKVWGAAKG